MAHTAYVPAGENWRTIAQGFMEDHREEIPESVITKYTQQLADRLRDYAEESAEEFILNELPDLVHDELDAARDAYYQRQIDEARGK